MSERESPHSASPQIALLRAKATAFAMRFPDRENPYAAALPPPSGALYATVTGPGTVYVVGFGEYVKIGFTTNFKARLGQLQRGNPARLTVYLTIPGYRAVERRLHERFADQRTHGEWFHLEDALRVWIKAGCPHET